jgi:hypothetical protein
MFRDTPLGRAKAAAEPVRDLEIRAQLNSQQLTDIHLKVGDANLIKEFTDTYADWILSSKRNFLGTLTGYQRMCSFAVTHVIEQFLLQHRERRFRILKAEYPGTRLLLEQNGMNWKWYEDEPSLGQGDALIISVPFAGSGCQHPLTEQVLQQAKDAGAPVLVDCAFFGFCSNVKVDLASYDVETVAFSVSKCFNVPFMRVGMIFSKNPPPSVALLHIRGYVARTGMAAVLPLFHQFGSDYLYEKYRDTQLRICQELRLMPSHSILFGLGDGSPEWSAFDKDGVYQRVSFGAFLPQVRQQWPL